MSFRSEVFQELLELRKDMKNLKETNTKVLHELRWLLRTEEAAEKDEVSEEPRSTTKKTIMQTCHVASAGLA